VTVERWVRRSERWERGRRRLVRAGEGARRRGRLAPVLLAAALLATWPFVDGGEFCRRYTASALRPDTLEREQRTHLAHGPRDARSSPAAADCSRSRSSGGLQAKIGTSQPWAQHGSDEGAKEAAHLHPPARARAHPPCPAAPRPARLVAILPSSSTMLPRRAQGPRSRSSRPPARREGRDREATGTRRARVLPRAAA